LPGNETTRIRISMKKSKKIFCLSENMSYICFARLIIKCLTTWQISTNTKYDLHTVKPRQSNNFICQKHLLSVLQPLCRGDFFTFKLSKMQDRQTQLQQLILLSLLLTIKMVCNG